MSTTSSSPNNSCTFLTANMLPRAIIIDVVFIPIYSLLLLGAIFNLIRHGRGRKAGYVQLVLFTSIRVVGNVLLTAAWCSHTTNVSVYVAGELRSCAGVSSKSSDAPLPSLPCAYRLLVAEFWLLISPDLVPRLVPTSFFSACRLQSQGAFACRNPQRPQPLGFDSLDHWLHHL